MTNLYDDYLNNTLNARQARQVTGVTPIKDDEGWEEIRQRISTMTQKPFDQSYYYGFDGNLLTAYKGGAPVIGWPVMSGIAPYQSAQYQNVKNAGPLPEGLYTVYKDKFQHYEDIWLRQKIADFLRKNFATEDSSEFLGPWYGGVPTWGEHRVDLVPDAGNRMYGRDGFTQHGGAVYGSAGCMDFERQITDYYNHIKQLDQNVLPVFVGYDPMKPFVWQK